MANGTFVKKNVHLYLLFSEILAQSLVKQNNN